MGLIVSPFEGFQTHKLARQVDRQASMAWKEGPGMGTMLGKIPSQGSGRGQSSEDQGTPVLSSLLLTAGLVLSSLPG